MILNRYFAVVNIGNEAAWEKAYDDTFSSDAVLFGKSRFDHKVFARGQVGKVQFSDYHLVKEIDERSFQYQMKVNGKLMPVSSAVVKDGKIVSAQETFSSAAVSNAMILDRYFAIFNVGDQNAWEKAYDETFQQEAIIFGKPRAEHKEFGRTQVGKIKFSDYRILKEIDDHTFEYQMKINGILGAMSVAVVRDGKIISASEKFIQP